MNQRKWGWFLLGISFCWAIPFFDRPAFAWHPHFWDISFVSGWMAVIWTAALLSPPNLRWHPALGSWIVWLAWEGISCAFSEDPWRGIRYWSQDACCVLLFTLAHAWWGSAHRRAWTSTYWLLAPLTAILWSHAESASLLAALPAAVFASWRSGEKIPSRLRWGLPLLGAAAAVYVGMYGSWGALFGLGASVVFCAALEFDLEAWKKYSGFIVLVLGWVILSQKGKISGAPEFFARLPLRPWEGQGLGAWVPRLGDGSDPVFFKRIVETGLIGGILFLSAAWKSLPGGNFKALGWESRAAAACGVSILAQSFVDGFAGGFRFDVILFCAFVCAAQYGRFQSEESGLSHVGEERHGRSKPYWVGLAGLLLCLISILIPWRKNVASAKAASSDPGVRLEGLASLCELEPVKAQWRVRLAHELLVLYPGRIGLALDLLDEAIRIEPRNPVLLDLKAELFSMVRDCVHSGEWAEKALSLDPRFVPAHFLLAESWVCRGEGAAALAQLGEAKRIHESAGPGSLWDQKRFDGILRRASGAR